jgi:tetratricopeptide (TPR) repeat protein
MRIPFFLFLLLFSHGLFAQKCIRQADKLIADKKYRAAWEVLDKADPQNKKPAVAVAKTNLLLKYFVNTVMHKVFTLKDLQSNEKIEDYRGKDVNGNLIRFDPEAVLDTLIKQHPTDYQLYVGLGNYYYETFIVFQENWVKKPETLVKLVEENYTTAYNHGIKTYLVAYRIGFARLFLQRFPEAKKSFSEAIELNKFFPDAYYSLAYSNLQLNQNDSALTNANKAYELFTDTFNRSDVNLLRGMIYSAKKDSISALKEYRHAALMNPKNAGMNLLYLKAELRYNAPDLNKVASTYFDIDPKAAETYSELINGYFQVNKSKEILALLDSKSMQYDKDAEITGDICFYRAYIYVVLEEKAKAKADLLKAKDCFLKIFPPEHEMFGAIQEALKELDK